MINQTAPIPAEILGSLGIDANGQNTTVPLIYAEQIVGLAVGPFVSKIILGVENPPGAPVPTIQISMPTNALHGMAKIIIKNIASKETQDQLKEAFEQYQESVDK
ncbi:hypothetical protein [Vogesella indigofera]|uniref:hypothetical protein n=1 Tax=Vogesella indigofera TaxID=45465 RepID=UPI00234DEB73|nr:hypothetical protein [Vogesella indigofera]MDC7704020.1 hypothetical protein [Vogesella indigofera]